MKSVRISLKDAEIGDNAIRQIKTVGVDGNEVLSNFLMVCQLDAMGAKTWAYASDKPLSVGALPFTKDSE